MKKIILILIGLALLLSAIVYILFQNYEYSSEEVEEIVTDQNSSATEEDSYDEDSGKEELSEEKVFVDIKGMIAHPGVYEVSKNSRVNDVIALAGGLIEGADTSLINLAKIVTDEMTIIVYSTKEVEEKYKQEVCTCDCSYITNDACLTSKEESPININTASLEELLKIPKIGSAKATAIIEYRKEHGLFKSIDEIKNVSGIGDALFEEIKMYLTI